MTLASQNTCSTQRIQHMAGICVTVAHATTTNRNILDRIEVLQEKTEDYALLNSRSQPEFFYTYSSGNCRILACHWHQMAEQIFRTIETETHIGGPGPFLQFGRIEIILSRRAIVEKRDGNFTIFQWYNFRIFGGTNDIIVGGNWLQTIASEKGFTIGWGVWKMLPRLPCLTIITGFLQRPQARPRRIGHTNKEISHMKFLFDKTICSS